MTTPSSKATRAETIYKMADKCVNCKKEVELEPGANICRKCVIALYRPDYKGECSVCGASPIVPSTGLCGPCTWGEASTIDGGWWDDTRQEAM